MLEFKTADGRILEFEDKPLGKGGEGAVYKQFDKLGHGDVGDLAKIFNPGKRAGKEDKLRAMLDIKSPQPSYSYVWPKELLYDNKTGEFCGYVMYLKHNKIELGEVYEYNSKFRRERNWRYFVDAAKNLAQAVAGVHAINQVIGDLNDKNILVDADTCEITLIDNDSFHITEGDMTHRCAVGRSEYIPAEVQNMKFMTCELPTFTQHTDNFSLAILIFKLLMNGAHPFNSVGQNDNSIEDNIHKGAFSYFAKSINEELNIAFYAPSIWMLPDSLIDLFKRSFIHGVKFPDKRPTAQNYLNELEKLSQKENLKTCSKESWHIFPKVSFNPMTSAGVDSGNECPWCEVERKKIRQLDKIAALAIPSFDTARNYGVAPTPPPMPAAAATPPPAPPAPPVKPIEPVKPVMPSKPEPPPVKPEPPPVKPAMPVKPEPPVKPAMPVKPEPPAKPAMPVKPEPPPAKPIKPEPAKKPAPPPKAEPIKVPAAMPVAAVKPEPKKKKKKKIFALLGGAAALVLLIVAVGIVWSNWDDGQAVIAPKPTDTAGGIVPTDNNGTLPNAANDTTPHNDNTGDSTDNSEPPSTKTKKPSTNDDGTPSTDDGTPDSTDKNSTTPKNTGGGQNNTTTSRNNNNPTTPKTTTKPTNNPTTPKTTTTRPPTSTTPRPTTPQPVHTVIYNMQNDANLSRFAGMGSSNQSSHTLLRSNGADRFVTGTAPNRVIRIERRGGTSQGIDSNFSSLNLRSGCSYRVQITGRVTTGSGSHDVWISTDSGSNGVLVRTSVSTNSTFTLTHTMTHSEITALSSGRYRFGGASAQILEITGITITEIS